MLQRQRNNRGQTTMVEYVVLFFLTIGAIIAMSVYVQRALQARIHGAHVYLINEASKAQGEPTLVRYEYEPYYGSVKTNTVRSREEETNLIDGGVTGIFRKKISENVTVNSASEQAPPKKAVTDVDE